MATGIALNSTTLSAAITASQNVFSVASATNIVAPTANVNQEIYVIGPGQPRGELMTVVGVNGSSIQVSRLDKYKAFWPNGSIVMIGPAPVSGNGVGGNILGGGFQAFDPPGASSTANSSSASGVLYTPWINIENGMQWIWSDVLSCWVPGWGNPSPPAISDAVASTAGAILPTGPLFHVTGGAAVTGFTNPNGWPLFGSFTVIPDGTFTWTTAGNIAVAGTAVINKAITFWWDGTNSKWVPSAVS